MPRYDGTGPHGLGAGSGLGAGQCGGIAKDDLSMVIIRFVLANWRPILGFILTSLLPLLARQLQVLSVGKSSGLPLLTPGRDKDKD